MLTLLSPLGLLVALAAAVPLAALALFERKAARVRRALQLPPPDRRPRLELAGAFVAVALLLGLAAAQPVVALARDKPARSDAEVMFVIDVSRSMEASSGLAGATRLQRAQALAIRVRAALGNVPAGLASMTDRTLPYLFPTANAAVFDATVSRSVAIEHPPPASLVGDPGGRATSLAALTSIATKNYFSPRASRRLMIALSDDESEPFTDAGVGAVFRKPPRVHTIFVHLWGPEERIYVGGRVDPLYHPDVGSVKAAASLALVTRGRAFDERRFAEIVRTAKLDLGSGSVRKQRLERARTPVAAWVAALALLPLGLVLRRRNL